MTALAWFVGMLVVVLAAGTLMVLWRLVQWLYDTWRVARVITCVVIVFLLVVAGWFVGRAIFGGNV